MKPLSKRLQGVIEILDGRIDWERRDRGSMRQDLSPMEDLMARMGHPERAFRTIHVAGSKGKGSVCALIAAGMTAAGVRVGRYGSPHVERLTERVEVCGREVADDLLAGALEEALEACQAASSAGSPGESATWFDLLTAAAFACFAKQEVEWVVVEVGLGGRLDSTNVVHGEVAVITTIELEHVELLGSTRGQIAGEKAGIIDTGAVVVCGPPPGDEAGDVIRARAEDVGARVVDVDSAEGITETNRALAGEALEAVGGLGVRDDRDEAVGRRHLPSPEAGEGHLPGRLERVRAGGVPVVLDGAHTPASLEGVLEELRELFSTRGAPQVVLSLAKDKDTEALLKVLDGRADTLHCTSVGSTRHCSADSLFDLALGMGFKALAHPSPDVAVEVAVAEAGSRGWVLVTGSLYLVGAVRGGLKADPESGDP